MLEGLLLGLSNGTACLAHCAPVMVPHFLVEGSTPRRNCTTVLLFLSGRFFGYLVFGVMAWIFGNAISKFPVMCNLLFGIVFILLSIVMVYSSLAGSRKRCAVKIVSGTISLQTITRRWLLTLLLGTLTGINFCPPFLLAFSSTAFDGSLVNTLLFFLMFYIGTLLFFFPFLFLGFWGKETRIQTVGKMTSAIMALYYFNRGLVIIAEYLMS